MLTSRYVRAMARRFARLLWLVLLYALDPRLLHVVRYRRARWLTEFNAFWTSGLHKRTPFDTLRQFEAYRTHLAKQFHGAHFPMPTTTVEAAHVWRDPTAACHLFSFIARREQHPLRFLKWMRWLPWSGQVLEFGAGAAPLADALDKSWPFPRPTVQVADIDWLLHDYQRWRFRGVQDVHVVTIPTTGVPWTGTGLFDGILCVETLEHVPDPLQTSRYLMGLLKPNGILIVDYGPQTKNQPFAPQGLTARAVTLSYLKRCGRLLRDGDGEQFLVIKKAPAFELHKLETI